MKYKGIFLLTFVVISLQLTLFAYDSAWGYPAVMDNEPNTSIDKELTEIEGMITEFLKNKANFNAQKRHLSNKDIIDFEQQLRKTQNNIQFKINQFKFKHKDADKDAIQKLKKLESQVAFSVFAEVGRTFDDITSEAKYGALEELNNTRNTAAAAAGHIAVKAVQNLPSLIAKLAKWGYQQATKPKEPSKKTEAESLMPELTEEQKQHKEFFENIYKEAQEQVRADAVPALTSSVKMRVEQPQKDSIKQPEKDSIEALMQSINSLKVDSKEPTSSSADNFITVDTTTDADEKSSYLYPKSTQSADDYLSDILAGI